MVAGNGGSESCALSVRADWRVVDKSTPKGTADAWAADNFNWQLPEHTQLRLLLPFLAWDFTAGVGRPAALPMKELEPLVLIVARASDEAIDHVRFTSHGLTPEALHVLVALLDKGFCKEPPVRDVIDFHRRVVAFFQGHECGPAFELKATDFCKVQAGFGELPPKLQWLAEMTPRMCAAMHPQMRCIAWAEWCYLAGQRYSTANVDANGEMCVLTWSVV